MIEPRETSNPTESNDQRFQVSEWRVEKLRLTAFPHDARISPKHWWKEVVRTEPDEIREKPKENLHQKEGVVDERLLILKSVPGRIDWLLRPPPEVTGVSEFPDIGLLPDALEDFKDIGKRWLELVAGISLQRIAFGATLLYPVDNLEEGYRRLLPFLHALNVDPAASRDLRYRINRRRESNTVPGLIVNRLNEWSVLRATITLIRDGAIEAPKAERAPTDALHACRLNLDVNTDAHFEGVLESDILIDLFEELVELAVEIAERGDVA